MSVGLRIGLRTDLPVDGEEDAFNFHSWQPATWEDTVKYGQGIGKTYADEP